MNIPTDIYVIGDTQIRPGIEGDLNPLIVVAQDIIRTLPNYIVHLGDHHDYPSLSSWDRNKNSFVERSYVEDTNVANKAFLDFWLIIQKGFNANPDWNPKFIFIEGNHENRRHKALEEGPSQYLDLLNIVRPDYTNWNVVQPFLKPYIINGICFIHYVPNEFTQRPISSAQQSLNKMHCSFVCGHKQTFDYAEAITLTGKRIQGLIMGACYYHNEDYRCPNQPHYRGCAYLRNVIDGEFELEQRSLYSLKKKYG